MSEVSKKFKVGDHVRRASNAFEDMVLGSFWVVDYVPNDEEIRLLGSKDFWLSEYFELVEDEPAVNNLTDSETKTTEEITSDGGSSSYYFTKLPKHLIDQIVETGGIEIKDIIRYVFDNNADAFNIVKAQKRIVEHSKGKGKAGITGLYDAKKITFFANEQYEAIKHTEENHG